MKDLQTTDRFELKRASETVQKEDTSVKAGVSISAKYGDTLQVKVDTSVAYDNAKSETEQQASDYSHHVVSRSSAVRYYEQIGVLPPAHRVSGQRRYDEAAHYRLAALQRARVKLVFTLDEIRQLFFAFRNGTPPSERWKKLSQRKLAELEELMNGIKALQVVLQGQGKCGCASLEECGKGLLGNGCGDVTVKSIPVNLRRGR